MISSINAQFVHPGITNKISDLDRVKYMVEAQAEPWSSSYKEMTSDSKASYNYSVRGNQSFTELGRDDGTNYNAWNDDIRAAYYNAIEWYVTGDKRHAEKSIEIFNAWNNLQDVTSGGTQALSGSIVYIMLEAAEIIKSTYNGWSASDIQDFKDMLVYPGYSTTAEPSGISRTSGSFYWQAYQGDSVRHGNQGLSGFRAVMAMGIFMDNEVMYDRALRYLQGLPHRSDDLPYPAGPPTATTISKTGDYEDTYNYTVDDSIQDFGYNEVITNYIYANGQCQESSRDQQHTFFGIGTICAMAEMAWNQGDDLYSHADDRLLLGLEYSSKYNVSYLQSYPDQASWWIPTVDSGEFMQRFNASQRVYAKFISPTHVGGYVGNRPMLEMPLGHYYGRGFKTIEEVKWTSRARDVAIDKTGYEAAGHQNGSIGWGALTSRRVDGCYGDPISGFDSNGLPKYNMNVLPMTIEAEHFDYFMVNGQGHVYNDISSENTSGAYRMDENVDIEVCDEGGYDVNSIDDGEWLTYTVAVPGTGSYAISLRYASESAGGTVKVLFEGDDKTGFVSLPATGSNQKWEDKILIDNVTLQKGVQSMKILVGKGGFSINDITISIVNKLDQTITFESLPIMENDADDYTLLASASSSLDITYTSSNPGVATVNGSTLQIVGVGNSTITASQAGNDIYNAAAVAEQILQVNTANYKVYIEAEDFTAMEGVKTEDTGDVDGVLNVGYIDDGDWMEYDLDLIKSGTYILNYRVASKKGGGSIEFVVDGVSHDTTAVDATGGWQVYKTLSATVSLSSGSHKIRVNALSGGWNFNWFELVLDKEDTLSQDDFDKKDDIGMYPNPVSNNLTVFMPISKFNEYTIFDISGRVYKQSVIKKNTEKLNIDLSNLSKGIYLISLKGNQLTKTFKFIK